MITGSPAAGGQHSFQMPPEQHVFFKQVDIYRQSGFTFFTNYPSVIAFCRISATALFSIHSG